jgi:hypothetical protein
MARGIIQDIEESAKPGRWWLHFQNDMYCYIDKTWKELLESNYDNSIRGKPIRYYLDTEQTIFLIQFGW